MTYFEKINEMKETASMELATAKADYLKVEAELAGLLGGYLRDARVTSTFDGKGNVIEASGETLDELIITVAYANNTKKYSLINIMRGNKFVKFEDIFEIGDAWDEAYKLHTELTNKLSALENTARAVAKEAAKKEARIKSAEASYERQKAKAIKDFEALSQATSARSSSEEFYYAIGWLAGRLKSIRAAMPDYLEGAFVNRFGEDTYRYVVDSSKRTVNGFPVQWALAFSAQVPKNEEIPAMLTPYLNPPGTRLTNTSFLWDLVENYGFKFSKKQDKEAIEDCIPVEFLASFEAGLMA